MVDTSSLLSSEEVSDRNKCVGERFDFEVINKDEGRYGNVHSKVCVEYNNSFEKNMEVKQKFLISLVKKVSVMELFG